MQSLLPGFAMDFFVPLCCFSVRIGDARMYGSRHSTADETYNITVRNVYAAGVHALCLAGEIRNLVFYGIECAEGTQMLRDDRGQ